MTEIKIEYIDHMGTDMSVVNAARVSMGKCKSGEVDEADIKLIKYLAKHGHWTPFTHAQITLRSYVPIFLERQLYKHQIGISNNSISYRYVTPKNEFYIPDTLRKGSPSIKQGSLDEPVENHIEAITMFRHVCHEAFEYYEDLLRMGVCKEQARAVLPLSTMTEYVTTGSLAAFARLYNQRIDPHAQKEAQIYAKLLNNILSPIFPVSWTVLTRQDVPG
jgi:thymidylate synthase (FAD)